MNARDRVASRRQFLLFLAASPLLSSGARALAQQAANDSTVLSSAKDALSVMDFEEVARRALPPAHWGYLATGVDDDLTLKANRDAFQHIRLKPRRLVDVSNVDLQTTVAGMTWDTPMFVCPIGYQRAFHADGELATARAARVKSTTMFLSSSTTHSVEDVAKTLGTPPWYQLYMPLRWDETETLVKRVAGAGCPAMAWTVDSLGGRNTETATRFARRDSRNCTSCHLKFPNLDIHRPMFDGLEGRYNSPSATWLHVDRLKALTKMKLLLKGIDSAEDARLAVEHGVDGLIVSNHGGRAGETLRATIDCLPEVVDAVKGRIPVLVDGGFRRGTDIFKALALGASGVGIGRPYIWGLAAFGQDGVERVLDIMRAELTLAMRQMGTPSVKSITRAHILTA